MSSHDCPISRLIPVYVDEHVDELGRMRIERHLARCDTCQMELGAVLEDAGVDQAELVPPPHVWEHIRSAIAATPPPRPRLRPLVSVLGPIAAAAAVAVLAGFGLGRATAPDSASLAAMAAAADAQPAAVRNVMTSEDAALSVAVVRLPDGTGYVSGETLPALTADRTYQLWAVTPGGVISAAVLGHRPATVPFQVSAPVEAFVMTEEAAGGVPVSEGSQVAAWSG